MLSDYAHAFYDLRWRLFDCARLVRFTTPSQGDNLSHWLRGAILETLAIAHNEAQLLGLEAVGQIEQLESIADPNKPGLPVPVSGANVLGRLEVLQESIERELRGRLFLYVPKASAFLYEHPELFGPEVASRFGRASFHIREAGSCLALGRPTAAVFHAMCVLEVAPDSLAAELALPYSEKNWNTILDAIKGNIDALPTGGLTWKEDKDWFSDAALELKFFRDAWRNHTAHGRAKYTEEEANNILQHVATFMRHLATRLQERP